MLRSVWRASASQSERTTLAPPLLLALTHVLTIGFAAATLSSPWVSEPFLWKATLILSLITGMTSTTSRAVSRISFSASLRYYLPTATLLVLTALDLQLLRLQLPIDDLLHVAIPLLACLVLPVENGDIRSR